MPLPTPTGRPIAVTLIGWLCIAGSIVTFVSGSLTLVISPLAGALSYGVSGARWGPPVQAVFLAMIEHLRLAALVEICVAAFALVAAIRFLSRRAWARTALEWLAWLWLAFTLTRTADWIAVLISLASVAPMPTGVRTLGLAVGALAAVVVSALRAVPAIVLIAVVRRRVVREAMIR